MKKYIRNIAVLLAAALTISSCESDITSEYNAYVQLSRDNVTFNAEENESIVIDIATSDAGSWKFKCEDDWVLIEADKSSMSINAEDNKLSENRESVITIIGEGYSADINVMQYSSQIDSKLFELPVMASGCMSRNGDYVGYIELQGYEANTSAPIYDSALINTRTGKKITLPLLWNETKTWQYDAICCISDDGRYIMYENIAQAQQTIFDRDTYEQFVLGVPESYTDTDVFGQEYEVTFSIPKSQSFSADGSTIVGYCHRNYRQETVGEDGNPAYSAEYMFCPVVWDINDLKNPIVLPHPQKPIQDSGLFPNGILVRDCSADGNVIYGSDWDFNVYGAIYWKLDEIEAASAEERETCYHYVGQETYDTTGGQIASITAQLHKVSPDGRWLISNLGYSGNGTIVLTDTQNETNEILDKTGATITVTNDRMIYTNANKVFDAVAGSTYNMERWSEKAFGAIIANDRIVSAVSSNHDVIYGYTEISNGMTIIYPQWYMVTNR